jgi:hypothetical protein
MNAESFFYVGGIAAMIVYNYLEKNIKPSVIYLAVDPAVSKVYGSGKLLKITVEGDLERAHVGMINKDGNFNPDVGNGIEYILRGNAIEELAMKAVDWAFV